MYPTNLLAKIGSHQEHLTTCPADVSSSRLRVLLQRTASTRGCMAQLLSIITIFALGC